MIAPVVTVPSLFAPNQSVIYCPYARNGQRMAWRFESFLQATVRYLGSVEAPRGQHAITIAEYPRGRQFTTREWMLVHFGYCPDCSTPAVRLHQLVCPRCGRFARAEVAPIEFHGLWGTATWLEEEPAYLRLMQLERLTFGEAKTAYRHAATSGRRGVTLIAMATPSLLAER